MAFLSLDGLLSALNMASLMADYLQSNILFLLDFLINTLLFCSAIWPVPWPVYRG